MTMTLLSKMQFCFTYTANNVTDKSRRGGGRLAVYGQSAFLKKIVFKMSFLWPKIFIKPELISHFG